VLRSYRASKLLVPSAARCALLLAALLLLCADASVAEPPPSSPLTIGPPRSDTAVDDLIREGLELTARGDLAGASEVWVRLRAEHPDHPAGPIFEINTLQARKSLDYQDTQYDAAIEAKATEALKLSKRWLSRAPDDARAHFYAGQAKYQLMMLWGMQGRYYRAGTTGEEARKHLERSVALDPTLVDAKLPLGTYYYWASIATRFIRWLTWLWFIPTGEHSLGLSYVDDVSRRGDFYRFDASAMLAQFYMYFENQPERAAPILTRLHEAYPENTFLAFEMVELRLIECDYPGAVEKALEMERSTGDQFGDATRRRMAKIWRARAELLQGNADEAREILDALTLDWQELASWGRRWLLLTKGNLADLSGRREQAVADYKAVIELKSRWESGRSVKLADGYLETPFPACVEAHASCDCGP
jgi:tetratricopeptide (TPR) repeat protein